MTQPLSTALLSYLKGEKITNIFGIVGGLLHPFFHAIENDPYFIFIQTRHEENAAFMADGYARVSGRMAVAAATSGPGATNLITGVSCAFTDGIPMLVITGNASTNALGKGAAQETNREDIDIVEMFRPITKYSAMITNAKSFAQHFQRAMRLAHSGRKGPIHLNIPVDLWNHQVSDVIVPPNQYRATHYSYDRYQAYCAAELLRCAKKPVFLVGSGVALAGASNHIQRLAELLAARVATSPKAKGVFPEDHPLSLGVFGNAGHKAAIDLLLSDEPDVLFAIGTSLSETNTLSWDPRLTKNKKLIQLDIDPDRIGRNYPVWQPIVGDVLPILCDILAELNGKSFYSEWNNAPAIVREYDSPVLSISDHIPVTPQRWRADLQTVLPDNAIIFSDIGGHMLFNIHNLCIKDTQRFFLNLNFGSMGHGTVAAMGAVVATDKPVFAIIGDACFTMNGMELLTAVENNIPVIWIVENNNMHGITHHCTKMIYGAPLRAANNKVPINIANIAAAMGLKSYMVDSPNQIQAAVNELLAMKAPGVIEVIVESGVQPPIGNRVKTLSAFLPQP